MLNGSDAGRLWPSKAQQLLLKAAIGTDPSAVDNYRQWANLIDLDKGLDQGSFTMLPLLYANMTKFGVKDELTPRLKGVYRNSWVRAGRRSAWAGELLALFRDAGIPVMASKGLPLALAYYESPALRPMNDLDLVVPKIWAIEASRLLESHGFRSMRSDWTNQMAIRHAVSHVHPEKGEVDLHWHMLFECLSDDADAFFREKAVSLDVSGLSVPRPCATDLLLHVLVHGIRWNLYPPMRWVADSAMILRSPDEIDWGRLTGFARRYRLTKRVGLGLAYLRTHFGLPIASDITDGLRGESGLIEHLEMVAMRGEDSRSPYRHLRRAAHVLRLVASKERAGLPRALGSELFSRYGPPRRASENQAGLEVTGRGTG